MSWTIFFVIVGLGILQLAVGVVFGRCLPLKRSPRGSASRCCNGAAVCRAGHEAGALLSAVTHDLDEHRRQVRRVERALRNDPAESAEAEPDAVLAAVGRLLEINEHLQRRLTATETRLGEQADELESHAQQARTDSLTQLPNRRAFDAFLAEELVQHQRTAAPCCLLLLDLDHFKLLNDRHGHLAGDQALHAVGDVLRRVAGEQGAVARLGGEEFAVLLRLATPERAQAMAEALRRAIAAEPLPLDAGRQRLTVSVGVAAMKDPDDARSLVSRADAALYAAKRSGRDCSFFHDGQRSVRVALEEVEAGADFGRVAEDLQRRLAEVANRE